MKVVVKKLALRSALDDHFRIEKWLEMGDEVTKLDAKIYYHGILDQPYYRVKTKGGIEGYVRAEAVK